MKFTTGLQCPASTPDLHWHKTCSFVRDAMMQPAKASPKANMYNPTYCRVAADHFHIAFSVQFPLLCDVETVTHATYCSSLLRVFSGHLREHIWS